MRAVPSKLVALTLLAGLVIVATVYPANKI